jgi:site-specific DNA-methyltransferase (adenine-specific)
MSGTAGLLGHLAIGDNLHILRRFVDEESIDLIYLDPPFNSNRAYSLIFRDPARGHSEAQAVAFKDQWTWNAGTEARFRDLLIPAIGSRATTRLSRLLQNQVAAFERTQMAAYLVEMAVRLVELHRVLKPTGSLYLHCDPTASHYLKVVLDAIFDPRNFRNEIAWERAAAKGDARRKFGSAHDTLLVYGKGPDAYFQPVQRAAVDEYVGRFNRDDDDGRGPYHLAPLDSPNPRPNLTYEYKGYGAPRKGWRVSRAVMEQLDASGRLWYPANPSGRLRRKLYLSDQLGANATDVWTDIPSLQSKSAERLGFPTQKPVALLKRIIAASSKPGDIVLDPFCGCGTAIEAARDLERRWIGIDISVRAREVINRRWQTRYGEDVPVLILAPADEEAARELAEEKPHGRREFEAWALTLIGARKNVDRDRGVDGLIPFIGPRGRIHQALVSVKSGRTKPSEVRDLVGAVHRERSAAGIFLTLDEPTKEMRLEAARAISLIPGVPRIQIITIHDALREDHPARPILPAFRQEELFEVVPDASDDLATLEDDLRVAIARGREAKAAGQQEWRSRIIETMQRALEAEPDALAPASPEGQRSPRTTTRGR